VAFVRNKKKKQKKKEKEAARGKVCGGCIEEFSKSIKRDAFEH
jgi:hypothetical protein